MTDPDIARLSADPAWPKLGKAIEELMDRHFNRLAVEFATKDRRPDYAELQWYRGYFACMKAWHRQPVLDAKELAKQLAQERGET